MKNMPFYDAHTNDFVLAAMCVCGHLHNVHGSLVTKTKTEMYRMSFEGNCCSCNCPKFRWSRWVKTKEMAKIIKSKRRSKFRRQTLA